MSSEKRFRVSDTELARLPGSELLQNGESADRYCARNSLKNGMSRNLYTGTFEGKRYFVSEDPDRWEAASHVVAGAFLEQYDFETPEIDYSGEEIIISSIGDPAIPVDSRRKEFRMRESIPNILQPSRADPETVADSFFTHLSGGAHDMSGNTVISGKTAYPIDFETFGRLPESDTVRDFISVGESYPEKLFSRYRNRLGFDMSTEDFRSHVKDRALEIDPERFWQDLDRRLEGINEDVEDDSIEFGENAVEYVNQLAGI